MTASRLVHLLLFAVVIPNTFVRTARILMIVYPQPSHVLMKAGIGIDLVRRRHDIHIALPASYPNTAELQRIGIRVMHYKPADDVTYPFAEEFEESISDVIYNRPTGEFALYTDIVAGDCRAMVSDGSFMELARTMNFDLVIVEPFIVNPCYLIVPHLLGVPFVSATAHLIPLVYRLPALPSFYVQPKPGPLGGYLPALNTAYGRLENAAALVSYWFSILPGLWGDTTLLSKHAPGVKSWNELVLRSELVLVENDHLLDESLPLLPHVVSIAGCTVEAARPLPGDLEEIAVRSGKHGIIVVSFGTSVYSLSLDTMTKFFDAFRWVEQEMVMRAAPPADLSVPDNVHLVKWLPQNDLLGHPKTKLFITHSGSNSQYEALYHGVPMLGIPMFAEQRWNCGRAERKGIALCLDLLRFTVDDLHNGIQELVENATWRTNIARLSMIVRDEPMWGREKAGFWISHVIKYGGHHLRSTALELELHEVLMFDLITLVLFALVCPLLCIFAGHYVVTRMLRTVWIKGRRDTKKLH